MAADSQDFGDVGQARQNFQRMSMGMNRLKEIMEQAEDDDLVNLETWVKELAKTVHSMLLSTGSMFVQEALRTEAAISRSRTEVEEKSGSRRESWSTG